MTGPRLAFDFLLLFWTSVVLIGAALTVDFGWQGGSLIISALSLAVGWIECWLWLAEYWEETKELGD